jgi:hypothetical protein
MRAGLGRSEEQPGPLDEPNAGDRNYEGKSAGSEDRVDLVVHGRDGKIRSKDSDGNESRRQDTEH